MAKERIRLSDARELVDSGEFTIEQLTEAFDVVDDAPAPVAAAPAPKRAPTPTLDRQGITGAEVKRRAAAGEPVVQSGLRRATKTQEVLSTAIEGVGGFAEGAMQTVTLPVDITVDTLTAGPARRYLKGESPNPIEAGALPLTNATTRLVDRRMRTAKSVVGIDDGVATSAAPAVARLVGNVAAPGPEILAAKRGIRPSTAARSVATPGVFDADAYVAEQIAKREAARTKGAPVGVARAKHEARAAKAVVVDALAPIEDAITAAAKAEAVGPFSRIPSKDITNQLDRVIMSDHMAGQFARDNGLEAVVREVPSLDHLDQYLIAKHARQLEEREIRTGRNLAADSKLVAELAPVYEPFAAKVTAYSRKVLDYAVDSGLVSRELAEHLKETYPDYIPMQRIFSEMEDVAGSGAGAGSGHASIGKQTVVRKIEGSAREIENPIESILSKTYDAFRQGEKNKAARLLTTHADLPGNPLGLKPIRTAENVQKRRELISSIITTSKERRAMSRASSTTRTAGRNADRSLKSQMLAVNKRMARAMEESQSVYEAMQAAAADFDVDSAIDDILQRGLTHEREITRLQDQLDRVAAELEDLGAQSDSAFERARVAAADGQDGSAPLTVDGDTWMTPDTARAFEDGLRVEQRIHAKEGAAEQIGQRYDDVTADAWDDAFDAADSAKAATMDRLERKGLRAEREVFELEAVREKVATQSKAALKRKDAEDTLKALKLAIGERSAVIKDLRRELFARRDLKKSAGDSTISFLNGGVRETWIANPEIARAAKGLDIERINLLGRVLSIPVRILKAGATGLNPVFIAKNVVRDQGLAAVLSSRSASSSLANPANFTRALFSALKHDELYDEIVRQGGLFTSFDIARSAPRETVESVRATRSMTSRASYVVRHPTQLLRAVEDMVARSEQLARLQQYGGIRDAMIAEGMPQKEAMIAAKRAALWTTGSFHRSGQWGRVLNGAVPYLNANIQGWRVLLRGINERPTEVAAKIAGVVFMPVAGVVAWNMADPERRAAWSDIAEREKSDHLIIVPPKPTKDERGRWRVIKIPLPQGVNDMIAPVRRAVEIAANRAIDGDARAAEFVGVLLGPEGGGNELLSSVTPQAVRPSIEVAANRNLYTGREIVPEGMKRRPEEHQVYPTTSGTARIIGRAIDASPLKVEHFVRATAGGGGAQLLNAADTALAAGNVIPEEQIGGESVPAGIKRAFGLAYGGERRRKSRQAGRR